MKRINSDLLQYPELAKPRSLSKSEVDRVVALRKKDYSFDKIGKILGRSYSAVRRAAEKNGFHSPRPKRLTEEEIDTAQRLHRRFLKGERAILLAEEAGISKSVLWGRWGLLGLKSRKKSST